VPTPNIFTINDKYPSNNDQSATTSNVIIEPQYTFDDILESLSRTSQEIIRHRSRSVSIYDNNAAPSLLTTNINSRRKITSLQPNQSEAARLQGLVADYTKRLKSINDLMWMVVNGIDSGGVDLKTIRRLAKMTIQQSTVIEED